MSWQEELKKTAREVEKYADELERKLRKAESGLADLAAGLHYTDAIQPSYSELTKLRCSAAYVLAELSKMPCRQKPSTWKFT